MLKRIELEALRADLQSVQGLLSTRTAVEDPIGVMQYRYRQGELEREIGQLADVYEPTAQVGLFFGGRPVVGSRGIDATFGSKAVEQFQVLVSTKYTDMNGAVGARGRLPQRQKSELLVTDVARGSFGFIMEEDSDAQFLDTPLKEAVTEIVDLIYRIGAPDEEAFEAGIDEIDNRLLTSLRTFFRHLDDAGATIRLVEDSREYSLMRDGVTRARERADSLTITEEDREAVLGTLFVLPDAQRFELHRPDLPALRGTFTAEVRDILIDAFGAVRGDAIGRQWLAELSVKTVRVPNRADRRTYRLVGLQEPNLAG
ncbi:hypothetical protein [Aureimonas glaciei]|uniref:Uncharacterized protein n=1 Tax=Aureimonas glaciei TaxID=1776957 RepID=A0A917D9Y3_9HYPH|nr:hypothetical protein [Aureimonas glaciei]GGD20070.1 hypothetical protein GCM10011335_23730 [Aureimonas glaciei]